MAKSEKKVPVVLLVSRSGIDGSYSPGAVIKVPAAEAKRMFETVPPQARPVRPVKAVETAEAVVDGAEDAAQDDIDIDPSSLDV